LLTRFPTRESVLPAPSEVEGSDPESRIEGGTAGMIYRAPTRTRGDEERGRPRKAAATRATTTAIYAAFISLWGELLRGLDRAELHTLAGIALCARLVVN